MKVIGVMHRLRKPSPFREPIRQFLGKPITNIGKENEELAFVEEHVQRFLKAHSNEELRLGVEGRYKENELDLHNPNHVFVSAVYGLQKRYPRLLVFPLEKGFAERVSDLTSYLRSGGEEAPLAAKLVSEAKKLSGYNREELVMALDAYRSTLMQENAEKENAHAIVIGGVHARHLENLNRSSAQHEYLYSPAESKLTETREPTRDLNALMKYQKIIKRVVQEFIDSKNASRIMR